MTISQSAAPQPPGTAPTCRVTVVTPFARVDVALPVQAILAELIPQLIRLAGAEGQASAENPGWVLSRLGGAPFPLGLTVTAAAIRDGDVLYLNPRERQAAPLLFDDVIDAIASAAESRAGAWGPKSAYASALGAAAAVVVGATLLLLHSLWGTALAPIGLGALAALALLGGGALARAQGDADAGAVCAGAGVPAALLAGVAVVSPHVFALGAAPLAAGLGIGAVYGVLAILVVAARTPWFLCLTVSSALGALAAAAVLLTDVRPIAVAGIATALATALAAVAPMISLRLAKLPLPRVPADMDSFRADEKPTMGQAVLDQTSIAERLLTGLLGGLGLVVAGSVVVLLGQGGSSWQAALAGTLGVVWLLRSRSYSGASARVVLMGVGIAVLTALGVWLAANGNQVTTLAWVAVLALAGVLCLGYANRVVRNRKSPYWSRFFDVTEFLGLMAIVPLVGMVSGLYDAIRGVL